MGATKVCIPGCHLTEDYGLLTRLHDGGKQAADRLIRADAWNAFRQEGIWHLIFVTHDGGFAQDIRALCQDGCEVTIMGRKKLMARRLKAACTQRIHLNWT